MEATGRYSDGVAEFFFGLGFAVSVVNPLKVKRFAESTLARNKTDKADAQLISKYAERMLPDLWQPASPLRRQLADLSRHLERLKTQCTREKNRLHEEKDPFVRESIERAISFAKQEIKNLQAARQKLIKSDPELT